MLDDGQTYQRIEHHLGRLQKLQGLYAKQGLPLAEQKQKNAEAIKDFADLQEAAKNKDYTIAVLGTIKAGKSTLLNSLLGREYSSTHVSPETASTVVLKSHAEKSAKVEVEFYSAAEWQRIKEEGKATKFWQELTESGAEQFEKNCIGREKRVFRNIRSEEVLPTIQDYSSSREKLHYFVKSITVYLPSKVLDLPSEKIAIVDTPGLDDPVPYRSEITKSYLKQANAAIVCVGADNLTGSETKQIGEIVLVLSQRKERIVIVGTKLDTLEDEETDWPIQKQTWQGLLGSMFDQNKDLLEQQIIGVTCAKLDSLRKWESGDPEVELDDVATRADCRAAGVAEDAVEAKDKTALEKLRKYLWKNSGIQQVGVLLFGKLMEAHEQEAERQMEEKFSSYRKQYDPHYTDYREEAEGRLKRLQAADAKLEEVIAAQKADLDKIQKQFAKAKQDLLDLEKQMEFFGWLGDALEWVGAKVVDSSDFVGDVFSGGLRVNRGGDSDYVVGQNRLLTEAQEERDDAKRGALIAEGKLKAQEEVRKKVQAKREYWNETIRELFEKFPQAQAQVLRRVGASIDAVSDRACDWDITDIEEINAKLEQEEFEPLAKAVAQIFQNAFRDLRIETEAQLQAMQQELEQTEKNIATMTDEQRKQRIADCQAELAIYEKMV